MDVLLEVKIASKAPWAVYLNKNLKQTELFISKLSWDYWSRERSEDNLKWIALRIHVTAFLGMDSLILNHLS